MDGIKHFLLYFALLLSIPLMVLIASSIIQQVESKESNEQIY